MKVLLPFTLIALCLPQNIPAEVENEIQNEIQYGVEAVAGFRSGYDYRGFELAESTIDFQLETEIALNNHTFLSLGSWYATETGKGDFDEAAFFSHLRFEKTDHLTLGLSATYRSFGNSKPPITAIFEDGVDLGTFATWHFNKDINATAGAYYDTGAEAWYGHAETRWSKVLSDKAFISLKTGVSYVDDYYGRNGMNDAYGRLSLTYHISDTVSITPFAGGSVLLDSDDIGDDQAYGGVWFEFRF